MSTVALTSRCGGNGNFFESLCYFKTYWYFFVIGFLSLTVVYLSYIILVKKYFIFSCGFINISNKVYLHIFVGRVWNVIQ